MSAPPQRSAAPNAARPSDDSRTCPPAADSAERQRIRWFVSGHVGAVALVYLIATWVGDGWAPPPFPPDLTAAQRQQLLAESLRTPVPVLATDLQVIQAPVAPRSADLAAPWHQASPESAR